MAKTSSYSVKTTPKLVVPPLQNGQNFSVPPFRRGKTSHAPPPLLFCSPPLPVISDQSLNETWSQAMTACFHCHRITVTTTGFWLPPPLYNDHWLLNSTQWHGLFLNSTCDIRLSDMRHGGKKDIRHCYFLNSTCDMVENKWQRHATLTFKKKINMPHRDDPPPPHQGPLYNHIHYDRQQPMGRHQWLAGMSVVDRINEADDITPFLLTVIATWSISLRDRHTKWCGPNTLEIRIKKLYDRYRQHDTNYTCMTRCLLCQGAVPVFCKTLGLNSLSPSP